MKADNRASALDQSASIRHWIMEVLGLFASPEAQRAYQHAVPFVHVPTEMFCMWADDHYCPSSEYFCNAFDDVEKRALQDFNEAFVRANRSFDGSLPAVEDFIASDQGAALAKEASVALAKLA